MYLEEEEVSVARIAEIFTDAFMDVSGMEENKFSVTGSNFPFPLWIVVNTNHHSITFTDVSQLHRISETDTALLCNELNKAYSFCRFYAADVNGMVMAMCEYDMTYKKGLIPYQVVDNFRWFEKIVGEALRAAFVDHIKP